MPKEEKIDKEQCPVCSQKSLELREHETEVPYFGKVFLFSMTCTNCKYHVSDVEAAEKKEPCKYTFEISSDEDLRVRVVKSSEATVKIPHITSITPGSASQGYVSNIEGILKRVKNQIEAVKETSEDENEKEEARKLLKKIGRILFGQEKQKIIIEDPSGNSAIISDKAVKSGMK